MGGRRRSPVTTLRPASLVVTMAALVLGVFACSGSSSPRGSEPEALSEAEVAAVKGSAYGYHANVSLFGGPPSARGPEPTVSLLPDASNSPQDTSVVSGEAVYGPAVLLRSGPVDVHTEGGTGPGGLVNSSSQVQGNPDLNQRPGPFLYDSVESTCTANEDGPTGSTTISNGVLETKYDPQTQAAVQTQPVPANPSPGLTVEGTLDHVGDRFRIVFNEQTANPDGSLTVSAVHLYLLGPIAVGDLIIGQTTCGITAATSRPAGAGAGAAEATLSQYR